MLPTPSLMFDFVSNIQNAPRSEVLQKLQVSFKAGLTKLPNDCNSLIIISEHFHWFFIGEATIFLDGLILVFLLVPVANTLDNI